VVPIVDIMDGTKRNLAKSHPGEVLFVPAPSIDDLTQYERHKGLIWEQRCQEEIVLALRDIRKRDCVRLEKEMREFYQRVNPKMKWLKSPPPGGSVFSADGVHPNDDGYDFWGRYIANAIVDEWQSRQQHHL
jgi:hypothetical protein